MLVAGLVVPDPELSWDDQLSTLRRPARWKLLTDDTIDHARLWRRPTVVHLSGCPLFELPALADPVHGAPLVDELRTVGVVGLDVKQAELIHAVTVDEHLALRQAEAEFFWHGTSKASAGVRTGRGMPKESAKNSYINPRFWMAIGVPIGDPAVRHRLVADIMLLRMFGEDEPPTESSRSRSALSGGRSKARSEGADRTDSDPSPSPSPRRARPPLGPMSTVSWSTGGSMMMRPASSIGWASTWSVTIASPSCPISSTTWTTSVLIHETSGPHRQPSVRIVSIRSRGHA